MVCKNYSMNTLASRGVRDRRENRIAKDVEREFTSRHLSAAIRQVIWQVDKRSFSHSHRCASNSKCRQGVSCTSAIMARGCISTERAIFYKSARVPFQDPRKACLLVLLRFYVRIHSRVKLHTLKRRGWAIIGKTYSILDKRLPGKGVEWPVIFDFYRGLRRVGSGKCKFLSN